MIKKYLTYFCILILIFLMGCGEVSDHEKNSIITQVSKLSSGFIPLLNLSNNSEGAQFLVCDDENRRILSFVFFHGYIQFLDSDLKIIFKSDVKDTNFIVDYKNEIYICENTYLEIFQTATETIEKRNKIYNLKDFIEISKYTENDYNTLKLVVVVDRVEMDRSIDGNVYKIFFSVDPHGYEIDKFCAYIETKNGVVYDNFIVINIDTISITIPSDENINIIVLKSPDYKDCIRKVSIEN